MFAQVSVCPCLSTRHPPPSVMMIMDVHDQNHRAYGKDITLKLRQTPSTCAETDGVHNRLNVLAEHIWNRATHDNLLQL